MTGKMMGEEILEPYRQWRKQSDILIEAGFAFAKYIEVHGLNAEDLGDWVETITTLLTFSPHVPDAADIPR